VLKLNTQQVLFRESSTLYSRRRTHHFLTSDIFLPRDVYSRELRVQLLVALTRQAMYVSRNIEAHSRNHYCYGKWISITDSECVILALVIRHANRMRLIMLSSGLSGSTIFPHCHIRHDFRGGGGVIEHKMCVLIFSTILVWEISYSEYNWTRNSHKCTWVFMQKYVLFLLYFDETWILSTDFRKTLKYKISWKSVQWEPSCSMRTVMTKLIITFHSFANAPKNVIYYDT
jgi:hypothetical protein